MQENQDSGHILDARGCPCPQPLIKTRRLWKTLAPGEIFQVQLDNEIAYTNLITFLDQQNACPQSTTAPGEWTITASKPSLTGEPMPAAPRPQPSASKSSDSSPDDKNTVVVIKSEAMGHGSDDLGKMLIKGYLSALLELDQKPRTIILYNGGALLAAKGSGADTTLAELAEAGIDILVCGACTDFYEIKDQLATGRISNMYEIAETMATADHVVYP